MSDIQSTYRRDGNCVPITTPGLVVYKQITYVAGTTGAIGTLDLFNVTGDVVVQLFARCYTNLASGGASTIEAGVTGNTASLSAQVTSTDIDAGKIWSGTSIANVVAFPAQKIIAGDTTIIQTIGTATVTGGEVCYYCVWSPISEDGDVTAV